jgi:hypothetical protein
MLASHCAIVAILLFGFSFCLNSHTSNADFLGHDRVNALGKSDLDRPSHLAAVVFFSRHDRAEGPNVIKILAHPITSVLNSIRSGIRGGGLIRRFSLCGKNRLLLNINIDAFAKSKKSIST